MTDKQLLEEYSKEIHGKYYYGTTDNITLVQLIESHRTLRNLNLEWHGAFREAQKEGYDFGYKNGLENAVANSITLDELRKMTIQDLANLIGDEND